MPWALHLDMFTQNPALNDSKCLYLPNCKIFLTVVSPGFISTQQGLSHLEQGCQGGAIRAEDYVILLPLSL